MSLQRLRLNGPLVFGLALVAGLVTMVLLPWISHVRDPHLAQLMAFVDGNMYTPPLKPGQYGFLWGTDRVGRDLFARVVYGARITLALAAGVNILRCLVAFPLGLWAGWQGRVPGRLTRALATGFGAIPTLLLVSMILKPLRQMVSSQLAWLWVYGLVLVVAGFPRIAEHVRRRAEEIRALPHIESAVAAGAQPRRIVLKHILPLMSGDFMVVMAAEMAWVLLMMGQLAVFGVFVGGYVRVVRDGFPTLTVEWMAEWSQMLGANRGEFLSHPWIPMYPGIALGLTAVCFHLLAEGLRLRSLRR